MIPAIRCSFLSIEKESNIPNRCIFFLRNALDQHHTNRWFCVFHLSKGILPPMWRHGIGSLWVMLGGWVRGERLLWWSCLNWGGGDRNELPVRMICSITFLAQWLELTGVDLISFLGQPSELLQANNLSFWRPSAQRTRWCKKLKTWTFFVLPAKNQGTTYGYLTRRMRSRTYLTP